MREGLWEDYRSRLISDDDLIEELDWIDEMGRRENDS